MYPEQGVIYLFTYLAFNKLKIMLEQMLEHFIFYHTLSYPTLLKSNIQLIIIFAPQLSYSYILVNLFTYCLIDKLASVNPKLNKLSLKNLIINIRIICIKVCYTPLNDIIRLKRFFHITSHFHIFLYSH